MKKTVTSLSSFATKAAGIPALCKTVKLKPLKKPTDTRHDFKDLGKSFTSPEKG